MRIIENVRLGDIAKVISGFAFKSSEFSDEGVPVVKIANIRVGFLDLDGAQRVNPSYLEKLADKYKVKAGDVLISLTGSHITQPNSVVGRVARASESVPDCLLNQRAGKVILNDKDRCDLGFLYYYLTLTSLRGDIAAMASGAASQANVSPAQVETLSIDLPPLDEQIRISSILSAYDDLIENNTRRIEILEEMARRLYEEWFCELQFPGCEVAVKDWSVVPFGSVLKLNIGGGWGKDELDNEHTNPGYVIRGTDIPSVKRLDVLRCPYRYHKFSNIRSRRLDVGDIVMEISGGSHDQSVGRTLYVSKELLQILDDDVLCASFCKRLVVDESVVNPLFAYYHLDHAYRSGRLDQFQVQSTGIKNFQFAPFLEKHEISIPPASLQEEFVSAAAPLLALHQALSKKNVNLRAQRDLLLPKLISGEIDVSDIPMPT